MALQDVVVYNKNAEDKRETLKGRIEGPWIIVNRGRHMKWGFYDAGTGMRIAHAAPTLKDVRDLVARLADAGLQLEKSVGWDYVEGPVWGDHKSYTSESIRAIGAVVGPLQKAWVNA